MKKLLALLLVLLMVLTACSKKDEPKEMNTDTPSKDMGGSGDSQITAEITWWAFPTFAKVDDTVGKYEQELVAEFNKKHPNIKVNVEMIDFQNGPEKLITAIQGGTAPDVLFDAPGRIVDYGRSGYLVPLNDLIKETGLDKDITSENILQASSDGTNYWMYPISSAPFVMAVNKTVLEKEGLFDKVPQTGSRTWTTAEFEALSKELAAKGYKGIEIYAGGQGGDQGTRAFISNLTDASIINDELSAYTMDSEKGIAAFTYVDMAIKEKWMEGNTQGVANDALEHFTTPINTTFWAVNLWSPGLSLGRAGELEASGIEAFAVALPSESGKPKLEYLVNGFAIFNNKDENKIAAAKEFVKFLADDEVIGKQNVKQTNAFPVRVSFGNLYEGNADMEFYASLQEFYGPYYNTVPGFANMRPFWWGSLQSMITGEKTPEEAAKYFTTEANNTLK